ncbi:predicted protein [Naegleria gruberi]|uniref:Predicted protein n=1 Tax=Naegleria gruberi TaxID=5762 RepID=D2VHU0_NAEGR|nr:uncharacterized protein NAEGRDRAFT_68445 [Naegleria gruberi]EFC43734.1 predicted protein [Naegleria gruberi]|eukprot:XP_002676478.1 predicted protein [Naegleria gruberi strain NEG-M]
MNHLCQLPDELWLSHIFEYLLGPVSKYKDEVEKWLFIRTLREIQAKIFKFDFDNLKGINSLSCICSDLRNRLFVSDFDNLGDFTVVGNFWLNVSNLVELTNYFTRFEDFSGLYLTYGDLYDHEALNMALIQTTLENIEMGIQSSASSMANTCIKADIYNDLYEMEAKTVMSNIETDFEERMSHMITSKSKYLKIREKTGISVYELFVYKAHIMSLEMVPNFDSEKRVESYYLSYHNNEHTLLSLQLSSKKLGEGCLGLILDEFNEQDLEICKKYLSITAVTIWSTITSVNFSNSLQYLSLVITLQEYNEVNDMLQGCHFPNLKLLSIALEDEEHISRDKERYMLIEKNLLENIKKSTFPKIIHLSLKRFFDYESISKIEVLDQLICLELISGYWGYNEEQIFVWKDGQVMQMLNDTYFKEGSDNCMQLLIIYNTIDTRWIDGELELMENFYNNCKERCFAGSISHSSVKEYYSNCNE